MEIVRKEELLKEFEVEASFYRVAINDVLFDCRSQARIRRKGVNPNYDDAVVVMVNPGSCNPANQNSKIPVKDLRNEKMPFIKAKSDPTMWQVMRLMKLKNWNQVNIINLSDLCTGSMEIFKEKLRAADNLAFSHHSIFSIDREQELKEILDAHNGPIIFGWGTDPFIKNYANEVKRNPLLKGYIGWEHEKSPFFYHPNQRMEKDKKEWLIRIIEYINKMETINPLQK